jgi:hypothetical protein
VTEFAGEVGGAGIAGEEAYGTFSKVSVSIRLPEKMLVALQAIKRRNTLEGEYWWCLVPSCLAWHVMSSAPKEAMMKFTM